jgi:hypothetical protein
MPLLSSLVEEEHAVAKANDGRAFFYFWGKEEKAVAKDTFSKAPKCR